MKNFFDRPLPTVARFTVGGVKLPQPVPLRGVGGGILHAILRNRWFATGAYPRTPHRLLRAGYAALRQLKRERRKK